MIKYRINSSKIAHQTIENETIVIDFETGAYYSIDGTGALIWDGISRGATPKQIVDFFAQHYEGLVEEIEKKIYRFMEALYEESLLIVIEGDISSGVGGENILFPLPQPGAKIPFVDPSFEKYTDMQDLLLLDPIHEVDEEGWPVRQQKSAE